MLPAKDRVRLQHMLDEARRAQARIIDREREDLDRDEDLSLVLQKLIENIGEAAKNVSSATCERTAAVEWSKIARMRDRLAHHYDDINLDILWTTVTDDLPPLVAELEALLAAD